MKAKRVTSTDIDNIRTESFLYKRFKLLALNMFEYEGLDALGIEERHLENWLFDYGKAIAFNDPKYGPMCLPGDGTGVMNVLGDPTEYRVTGFNYTNVVKAEDCVVIENNKLRMPTNDAIVFFTNQLYNIVRTRDVNINTLKLPFIGLCNDKDELTIKTAMDKVNNNEPVIFLNKEVISLDEFLKVLPTGVKPFTAELTDQYHDILNEALTYLGINNANTDKKERLISHEVDANNQFIDSCAQMFLEARQRACDEINEKFGTNISVKLRNGGDENEVKLLGELLARGEQSDNPDT